MESIKNIDWLKLWSIFKDIILPHSGTLLFNCILFLFIGFILSILYIVILSKKQIFIRKPKYYNWAVKLYIPLLILGFLYLFGQIGLTRGVYKILHKEKASIVSGIFHGVLDFSFESEESKNIFIKGIQQSAIATKDGSNILVESIKDFVQKHGTGNSLIDNTKNKASSYLIEKYGEDIYKMVIYGMITVSGKHININESLPYDEFSTVMDIMLVTGYKDIEQAITNKLTDWSDSLLSSQYHSMVKSLLILLLILISIPLLEYFIYKKWIEPSYLKKISSNS